MDASQRLSILPCLACRLDQTGTEPPNLQLIDDLAVCLNILEYFHQKRNTFIKKEYFHLKMWIYVDCIDRKKTKNKQILSGLVSIDFCNIWIMQ